MNLLELEQLTYRGRFELDVEDSVSIEGSAFIVTLVDKSDNRKLLAASLSTETAENALCREMLDGLTTPSGLA